jgi:hypothetical protein
VALVMTERRLLAKERLRAAEAPAALAVAEAKLA